MAKRVKVAWLFQQILWIRKILLQSVLQTNSSEAASSLYNRTQSTDTKGLSARLLFACIFSAMCSLPVTLSPNIGTLRFVGATCLILSYIFLTLRLYVQEWVLLLIQNKAALITRVLLNHLNYCMRLNSVANKKAYFTGEEMTFKYTDVSDLATQENMIFLV